MTRRANAAGDGATAVVSVQRTDERSDSAAVSLGERIGRRLGIDPAADATALIVTAASGRRVGAVVVGKADGEPHGVGMLDPLATRLGVGDGAHVTVERAAPTSTDRIVVAPVADLSVNGGRDAVRTALSDRPAVVGDLVSVSLLGDSLEVPFRLVDIQPEGATRVNADTEVGVRSGPAPEPDVGDCAVPPTTVGGYDSTIEAIDAGVVGPLVASDAYAVGGRSAASGVIVAGPAGVGKSHHVRRAAWAANASLVRVDTARLVANRGAADDRLEAAAERAATASRALVHIDGLDVLTDDGNSGSDAVVQRLARWIGRLVGRSSTVVVGEAIDPDALPQGLVRGDRLSRHVRVPRPDAADRTAVFRTLTDGIQLGPEVDLQRLGERTVGYVAADLVGLRGHVVATAIDRSEQGRVTVRAADVTTALAEMTPATVDAVDVPDVSFEDVGGLTEAKRELTRAVEWPLQYPDQLARLGIDAPGGVLLCGPPGTGKTLVARAVASTSDANFFSVAGPELFDKFVGESERAVRELFERAREAAPAVVFFDELDALGSVRTDEGGRAPERVVSQLLTELDGLDHRGGVTVVGATNRQDRIDPALLRPGRFERVVEVGLPERTARRHILEIHARDRPIRGVNFDALAARTEGYSGSDLAAVLREASRLAFEQFLEADGGRGDDSAGEVVVNGRHVEAALDRVTPSQLDED